MLQVSTERAYDKTWLGGQGDPLGIVPEIEVWLYEQMLYAQPWTCPEERDAQTYLWFWDTNGSES